MMSESHRLQLFHDFSLIAECRCVDLHAIGSLNLEGWLGAELQVNERVSHRQDVRFDNDWFCRF